MRIGKSLSQRLARMSVVGKRLTIAVLALVLVPAVALAGTGVGAVFNLGKTNTVNAQSTLTGSAAKLLQVTNTSTGASSSAIGANSKGSSGPTIKAGNTGGGPALGLTVGAGKAPFTVNSTGKVTKLNADLVDGLDSTAFQHAYNHTIVVSPVGSQSANGTALSSALNVISDNSSTNTYLVKIEPGIYDLNDGSLAMKPYVDIEGSGQDTTMIDASPIVPSGAVTGASNAELRFLTVENDSGYGRGIQNTNASPTLTHITALATAPGNVGSVSRMGIYNSNSSPLITEVTASATDGGGAGNNYGIYNDSSSPTMTLVTATASGGAANYGILNSGGAPTMTYFTAQATSPASHSAYAVDNVSSSPVMNEVVATATSGSLGSAVGVFNQDSSLTMNGLTATASGGSGNYGIENFTGGTNPYTVKINNSQIIGPSYSVLNDPHFTVRIGGSLLDGTATANGGTLTCAAVWSGSYVLLGTSCT